MADDQSNVYSVMLSYLQSLGLGQLATVNTDGSPGGWLWSQITGGTDTADELQQAIEQTDLWRDRFGLIVAQRQAAAAGKPVKVMSVNEVVAYESAAAQLMRQANLPTTFYDSYQDFQQLALKGVSIAELSDKLGDAFNRARNVAPEIRTAFENFYGVGQGDSALAAYFLDPEKSQATLDKQSRSAYAAGLGAKYGINVDKTQAEQLSTFAASDAAVQQGLGQVAAIAPITDNGLFETNKLSTDTAIKSVFEQNAAATADINRRVTERRSVNSSAVGGAALTSQGLLGAGTAS